MTILILHGIGGHAGIHWQQWLKDELQKKGHTVLMPDLPAPDRPDRTEWLNCIKEATQGVDPANLVIVGHSLGATSALDFIEQLDQPIHGLVSVSGFSSDYGAELNSYFLKEKEINFDKVNNDLKKAAVLYGNDDPYVTQTALREVSEGLDVTPHIIKDGGHLNSETGYTDIPLLVDVMEREIF
jgi:predicted alpha/beta hydrolase family esterase